MTKLNNECYLTERDLDDGLEEGEIVDDDLEAISDDSIVFTPCNGKSLSHKDHLHDLSLSSITDVDMDEPCAKKRRKKTRTRIYLRKHKLSKRKVIHSESSDDDISLDKRLKIQLKAAVRVDRDDEKHVNKSLRTRLRGMVQSASGPESDGVLSEIVSGTKLKDQTPSDNIEKDNIDSSEKIEEASEHPKEEENDNELIQLRIEALKTAIKNKFANRKRRKKEALTDETNKENTTSNNTEDKSESNDNKTAFESSQVNKDSEQVEPPPPEEDEDVLRALLLASMARKITKLDSDTVKKSTTYKPIVRTNNVIVNNVRTTNITKNYKINNMKTIKSSAVIPRSLKVPQVKPLIITVGSDSDSDLELCNSPKKLNEQKKLSAEIESSVDIFLREQRKQVESVITETAKEVASNDNSNVGKASENIELITDINLENKIPDKNTIFSKKTNVPKTSSTSTSMGSNEIKLKPGVTNLQVNSKTTLYSAVNKKKSDTVTANDLKISALKFLPKDKREEYKKLQDLLKLKRAQLKKPRVRKLSQRLSSLIDGKSEKNIRNAAFADPQNNIEPKADRPPTATISNSPNELVCLCGKEIENKFSEKRRTDGLLLQNTLKQMQIRKDQRLQIQEKYSSLRPCVKKIKELTKNQKHWDQQVKKLSYQLDEARRKQQETYTAVSTSVRDLVHRKQIIDESLTKAKVKTQAVAPVTSTPLKKIVSNKFLNISGVSLLKTDNKLIKDNKETPYPKDLNVTTDTELNVADPNDIDKIIKKTEETIAVLEEKKRKESYEGIESDKVRYVSPLDCFRRKEVIDPFTIFCPFETNGTCKDSECPYNHLPISF